MLPFHTRAANAASIRAIDRADGQRGKLRAEQAAARAVHNAPTLHTCTCAAERVECTHPINTDTAHRAKLDALGPSKAPQALALGTRSDFAAYRAWRDSGQGPHPTFSPTAYAELHYEDNLAVPLVIGNPDGLVRCQACGLVASDKPERDRQIAHCSCGRVARERLRAIAMRDAVQALPVPHVPAVPEARFYRVTCYPTSAATCSPVY